MGAVQVGKGCFSVSCALQNSGISTISRASTHLVSGGGYPVFGILYVDDMTRGLVKIRKDRILLLYGSNPSLYKIFTGSVELTPEKLLA